MSAIETGVVKWYNRDKGYGFIKPDGHGDDVFVHAKQLEASGLRDLREGDRVEFEKKPGRPGDKRLSAHNLKLA